MIRTYFLLLVMLASSVQGYVPTNMNYSYDRSFTRELWFKNLFRCGVDSEYMLSDRCYSGDESVVQAPQIYSPVESGLAFLEGAAPNSKRNLLANRLRGLQDDVRGTFTVDGSFHAWKVIPHFSVNLRALKMPGDLTVSLFTPVEFMSFSDISWKSNTKNLVLQDKMVRTGFADSHSDLVDVAKEYGNLDLRGHSHLGLGDVCALLKWDCIFLQNYNRLREVIASVRAGMTLPTARQAHVDRVFDVTFGHDGTVTFPLGAGIQLGLADTFSIGVDVGMTLFVRRKKEWRLKSSWAQTEHLIPSIGEATKEYGPEWRFKLYGQFVRTLPGTTLTVGYEFFKHAESTFYPQEAQASASVINTTARVDTNESHSAFFQASWTPRSARHWPAVPAFSVGAKIPFNGKRMLSGYTVSLSASTKF